jgi:hypothetical protein
MLPTAASWRSSERWARPRRPVSLSNLTSFVAAAIGSGIVTQLIARHGVTGLSVAGVDKPLIRSSVGLGRLRVGTGIRPSSPSSGNRLIKRCAARTPLVDKRIPMKATKTKAACPERRGSGVKFVYDLLRDEILDLVLPPGSPIDECSSPSASACRARRSARHWCGWLAKG